jgi:hypothetical protein
LICFENEAYIEMMSLESPFISTLVQNGYSSGILGIVSSYVDQENKIEKRFFEHFGRGEGLRDYGIEPIPKEKEEFKEMFNREEYKNYYKKDQMEMEINEKKFKWSLVMKESVYTPYIIILDESNEKNGFSTKHENNTKSIIGMEILVDDIETAINDYEELLEVKGYKKDNVVYFKIKECTIRIVEPISESNEELFLKKRYGKFAISRIFLEQNEDLDSKFIILNQTRFDFIKKN